MPQFGPFFFHTDTTLGLIWFNRAAEGGCSWSKIPTLQGSLGAQCSTDPHDESMKLA